MKSLYTQPANRLLPNIWDVIAFLIVVSIIAAACWGGAHMSAPFKIGQQIPISLNADYLPEYVLLTTIRMFIALFFSFVFAITVGAIAAKSKRAGKLIIPLIDILQSVPILGYMSISVAGFIALFPGSMLGPECAVVFVVFSSQVWNMTLSVYQSLRTVPNDLVDITHMYRLSGWQRFWKLELPFATPGLLWNAMISMSAGWFFIVAAEAISIANQQIFLPGIGSYIAVAIEHKNLDAIGFAIITMLIVILLYDQLFFRPLIAWSEKFRNSDDMEDAQESWFLTVLQRAKFTKHITKIHRKISDKIINARFLLRKKPSPNTHEMQRLAPSLSNSITWYVFLTCLMFLTIFIVWHFIFTKLPFSDTWHVVELGGFTALRVLATVVIGSLIWVPIGVYVGMRPKIAKFVQPLSQILAAFPANLFFPVFVMCLLYFHLSMNIWSILLMMLGTQWYILFNVIAGASIIPKELRYAAKNMQLKGFTKWRRFYLPAIFPFFVTGAITSAGGAWNASIVAEFVSWGHTTLIADGLGSYITINTIHGNFAKIALGVVVMCLWVVVINLFFWRKLYDYAEQRFRIE